MASYERTRQQSNNDPASGADALSRLLSPIRRGRAAPSLFVASLLAGLAPPGTTYGFPRFAAPPSLAPSARSTRKERLRRNGTVNRLNDGQPYAHSCNSRHVDATARIPAQMRNNDKPEPSEILTPGVFTHRWQVFDERGIKDRLEDGTRRHRVGRQDEIAAVLAPIHRHGRKNGLKAVLRDFTGDFSGATLLFWCF